jgi:hypothetical protein
VSTLIGVLYSRVKIFSNILPNIAARLLLFILLSSERNIKMKTIKASLLLPLLTILFSLAISGCYTQLAFVYDKQYSTVVSSSTMNYQPEIVTVYVPVPIYDPPSPPVYYPVSTAGSTSTVIEPQSQSQTRDSGYQRSGQSENTQTTSSVSDRRTSGSTRSGR